MDFSGSSFGTWVSRAILLVREEPSLMDFEVAQAVGVEVQVLVANDLYRRMAAFYRGTR